MVLVWRIMDDSPNLQTFPLYGNICLPSPYCLCFEYLCMPSLAWPDPTFTLSIIACSSYKPPHEQGLEPRLEQFTAPTGTTITTVVMGVNFLRDSVIHHCM